MSVRKIIDNGGLLSAANCSIGTSRRSAAADHHGSNWDKTGDGPRFAPIASGAHDPNPTWEARKTTCGPPLIRSPILHRLICRDARQLKEPAWTNIRDLIRGSDSIVECDRLHRHAH